MSLRTCLPSVSLDITDVGLGVVHTVDGLVDNLLVALSDSLPNY